jgi:hypothetical protein
MIKIHLKDYCSDSFYIYYFCVCVMGFWTQPQAC